MVSVVTRHSFSSWPGDGIAVAGLTGLDTPWLYASWALAARAAARFVHAPDVICPNLGPPIQWPGLPRADSEGYRGTLPRERKLRGQSDRRRDAEVGDS